MGLWPNLRRSGSGGLLEVPLRDSVGVSVMMFLLCSLSSEPIEN